MRIRRIAAISALLLAVAPLGMAAAQAPSVPPAAVYANFRVSVYITVGDVHALADRAVFDRQFARVGHQVHIDKVYIESYRDGDFASDDELERVKGYFRDRGIETWGGVTLAAGGKNGQFATFDYEDTADRERCARAMALAARHFDSIILDDFFFFNTKSEADIAAKGRRSWTQYRVERLREIARDWVIAPARKANPKARVIIKYPNWYEHFRGLGFDLGTGGSLFAGIHTGTETRDPVITDQLLQQYESYEVIRYFDNIAPGRNGGGWVDTYDTRYLDRYAEQLWDTLLAKAPEITLFNWRAVADANAAVAGNRPWGTSSTSFDWSGEQRRWNGSGATQPPGLGRAAGYALETVDSVLGALGKPVGVASYRPVDAQGEDFLHNYLGNIGIPIELTPTYPMGAKSILLTEAAAADPDIVGKIKTSLRGGATVVVTSGLVEALAHRGFSDLVEWAPTGHSVAISRYVEGAGAGAGTVVEEGVAPTASVLFPEMRFFTNDSWAVVRGVAGSKGYPIVLTNDYAAGTIAMIAIPNNPSDLYTLPTSVLSTIRTAVGGALPVRLDQAPDHVALFVYDNGSFVVQSFRDEAVTIDVVATGAARLSEVPSGTVIVPTGNVPGHIDVATNVATGTVPGSTQAPVAAPAPSAAARFTISLPAHSFRAFRVLR